MSHSCCSGNFSSRSLRGYCHYPGSSCGSSYPSNLVYSTDLCSPSSCPQGSSLYSGCQEICWEPTSCQTSCSSPRTPTLCHPRWTTYPGSLGCGSGSSCSLGYGSRGCYPLSCGSSVCRPLGYRVCGFPSQSYRASSCRPTCFSSSSCQSPCYRAACRSGFYY
ncbi:keratin-associated protein 13-1-like [Saccopteryx bilineata]|uniref:keratin-associated protein 13-1-like n=1 Tax=Saccopteryx bilineata TaxID=59482 RepID=UPI00338E64E1